MANKHTCECGGLRSMCAALGKHSINHYRRDDRVVDEVVWGGRGELLGPRDERPDTRIWQMPTYDLDDGERVDTRPPRKYTRTGRHVGKCSRTNPNAPQYLPKKPLEATDGSEAPSNAGTD